jgi:toxin CcdB
MAQFDVYENPSAQQRAAMPFMVVIQRDFLDGLPTRLAMPLAVAGLVPKFIPLNSCPQVEFHGQRLHVLGHMAAAFRNRDLRKPLGSLAASANDIVAAIDAVISGV